MTETGAASVPGLAEIADIGRDTVRGGYSRHLFDEADRQLREWFAARAAGIGLDVDHDRNGNIWAWWGPPGPGALVTGSHLDSVPGGGAFDGPLGVVSALDAVQRLIVSGFRPSRPVAVVVFGGLGSLLGLGPVFWLSSAVLGMGAYVARRRGP